MDPRPSTPPATPAPPAPTAVRDALLRELGNEPGAPLRVGGLTADELAARFGTPLYLYDATVARRQLAAVQAALGPRVDVLYALKANPCLALAEALAAAGAGAEVASAGEIAIARAAGVAAERIHFAGPGKDGHDLDAALGERIGSLNVESEAEYEAIAARVRAEASAPSSRRASGRPRVAIRVNPQFAVAGSRLRMAGGGKKFGVDHDHVATLARRIAADGVVELRGLHVYAGTQCFDAGAWLENAAALVDLAARVEANAGVRLPALNFGGGFGVPSFEGDVAFDLAAAGRGLAEVLAGDAGHDRRQYFVELGRFLVAACGVYLMRVTYVKESGGKRHAILDGGMHHHAAAAGFGAVIRRTFPIVAARDPYANAVAGDACPRTTLGGPLCTPADELAADTALPELRQGDLVAVLVSGAYGLTFSPLRFLSHPTPAEVLIESGEAHLARERGSPADALRGQYRRGTLP